MTKKEFIESVRTYKLLIVAVIFLLFGMLNPITAKIMPELMSSLMPEGMTITLAAPSAIDSWIQFYKNMSTQLILFIIVFSGIVANELSKGTLTNMLTKGLSRKTVILSKFVATTLMWTVSYLICFGTTFAYTMYLLPGELPNIALSGFCMWLFGVLQISIMLLGGVLFGSIYGSLLLTGGFTVLLMLINIAPKLSEYNPYLLSSESVSLLTSNMAVSDFYMSIFVTFVFILFFIIISLISFEKKQI
ncbi:MAG: ABC transporter permease subunit, partial [Oscillospiraceae bacterium]